MKWTKEETKEVRKSGDIAEDYFNLLENNK